MKKAIISLFVLSACNAFAQNNLFVSNGVTLKIDGATVTFADTKLTNNGTVDATTGSTLAVKGTATTVNSSLAGTGTTTLGNLTIDKSSNDAQIDHNISVSGNLTMSSGNLKLNAGNINLIDAGQIVGEADGKRIYGTGGEIITTVVLNAPTDVNPGNLGASITSSANLGSTTVKCGHTAQTVSGSSITRYYDITPTTNTGLNATLKFFYKDSELNGNTEANLTLWRSADAGATWTNMGKDLISLSTNFIQLGGINAFSRWTAAAVNVLPVELLSFSGRNTEGGNLLTWATASEVNNKGFQVERRQATGNSWDNIGFVTANNKASNYQFTDNQPFATSYYRLRQIDFDGTETVSKVVSVVTVETRHALSLHPNPVSNVLTVEYTEGSLFQVINLLGQQVLVGKTTQQLDVSALPQGTYVLKIGTDVAKFVKQ